ncbi:MAG: Uma2 family endonuclease [Solirubrobacterales bacterium]|nr:Uma2 family endonuclease [Solirubrobacterales bacterium]
MAVAQRMTIAEYLELDDERRTSLVDGEVVVNEIRTLHQVVMGELLVALTLWCRVGTCRGQAIAPIDVALDEYNCYGPDLLWYREGRTPGRTEVRPQPLPDIAVEIRSPSTWRYDIGPKKARYEQHGLPELWLVDTAADEVIIYRRSHSKAATFDVSGELARGETLTSPLLPGFALTLDALFGPSTD